MQRSENVSGMHKDDITREILRLLDGRTITDGLGHPLRLEADRQDGQQLWVKLTDHKGRVGTCYIGIGR